MPPRHDRLHKLASSVARGVVTAARKSEDLEIDSLAEPDRTKSANLAAQAAKLARVSRVLHTLLGHIKPAINLSESHVPTEITRRQLRHGSTVIWHSEHADNNGKKLF